MAVLYELLTGGATAPARRRGRQLPEPTPIGARRREARTGSAGGSGAPADLLVRGARVLDPRAGVDDPLDVVVREGEIAELGQPGSAPTPTAPR